MFLKILGLICLLSPLLGFLIAGFVNKRLPDRFSQAVTCGLMALSAGAALIIFYDVIANATEETYMVLRWIDVGHLQASWGLKIDALSATMMAMVTVISFLVHIYSIGYMSHDAHIPRFMAYLSFFTFSMLALVMAPNLVQLFFGWEGVGLASYLLIGFWYHKAAANAAAMKAFIVNRVGDIGLALGIAGVFLVFHTVSFDELMLQLPDVLPAVPPVLSFWGHSVNAYNLLGILFFLGAMGKSAQLGLHTWLPDAMEGPTPVSALIHAATMVTAGVFLVVRLSPLYELAPIAREVMVWVGAGTAFFAATVALTQTDIKRVIAYSTCSQLGYMFFAAGCSAYAASLFHLVTHAFFKALLFLGAGAVIHAMSDEQDLRRMGGLWKLIPVTYSLMWIGSLALAGIPYFAGYYSKHAILGATLTSSIPGGHIAFVIGVISAVLTAFYSWRLLFMAFHGQNHADERVMAHVHEAPLSMQIPMCVLAIGAVFSGMAGESLFIGNHGLGFWGQAIKMLDNPFMGMDALPWWISWVITLPGIIGIAMAYGIYQLWPWIAERFVQYFYPLYIFSLNKWYFDQLFQWLLVRPVLTVGMIFWRLGDIGIIDRYGPNGVTSLTLWGAHWASRAQTGYVYHYAFAMLFGLVMLLFLYYFSWGI